MKARSSKNKKKKTKQTSIRLDDFFAYLLKADKDIFIHTLKNEI